MGQHPEKDSLPDYADIDPDHGQPRAKRLQNSALHHGRRLLQAMKELVTPSGETVMERNEKGNLNNGVTKDMAEPQETTTEILKASHEIEEEMKKLRIDLREHFRDIRTVATNGTRELTN
ncbi:hypothetical protein PV11_05184 [Exophiala sideris]|uniref:Uncharacterized protein n=1 Tax=Exophiala sideris TaxID=1016849 RepID=A0A0D1X604_9EURO|nr:hypothetical protein PV11_05184 [Exophiala sideris]